MIIRIVKMTFQENKVEEFQKLFDVQKEKIRNFEGVEKLELLREKNHSNIFFTYSIWTSESDLETYRQSDLFKEVWSQTKALFGEKAQAWTVNKDISI